MYNGTYPLQSFLCVCVCVCVCVCLSHYLHISLTKYNIYYMYIVFSTIAVFLHSNLYMRQRRQDQYRFAFNESSCWVRVHLVIG